MTVNFPGIASLDSAKLSVGGVFALEQKHKTKAVFTVFRGPTYDILLVEGGMSHEGSMLCDQPRRNLRRAADHADGQLPRHPPRQRAKLSVGGVFTLEQKQDRQGRVFTVFRGPTCDILLVKGGMRHEGSILCDDAEETYDACTLLTVSFAGASMWMCP